MDAILLERGPYELFAGSIEDGPDRQSAVTPTRLDCSGNLADEFQRACCRYAARTALIEGDQAISYAWLYQAALAVRDELATRTRLAPGSPVTLLLDNSPEYLAAFYGVLLAGGVVVPLPPRMEARRWRQIQASSGSGVLITREQELASRADLSPTTRRRVSLTGEYESFGRPHGKPLADSDRSGNDLAMVVYTSGSTGLPKGVMLSHRNLLANTQSILDYLPIREDDRTLVVLPFCLAFGNSILQTHLLAGRQPWSWAVRRRFPSRSYKRCGNSERRRFPPSRKSMRCCCGLRRWVTIRCPTCDTWPLPVAASHRNWPYPSPNASTRPRCT